MKTNFQRTNIFYLFTLIFVVFGCCFACKNNNAKQNINEILVTDTVFNSWLDSLEWVTNNTNLPLEERLLACDILSFDLVYIDINKSKSYAKLGLELLKGTKKDLLLGSFYRNLGMAYAIQENYDSAQLYYKNALTHAIKKKNEDLESFIYLALGLLYSDISQYKLSAEYYEKALKLCEKNGFKRRYSTIISNIGITHYKMSNYELAEKYFLEAKEVFLKNEYYQGLAHVYLNLGRMYFDQDRIEEAYEASTESMNIFQSTGDKSGEALALINMSRFYLLGKNYDKSLENSYQSLRLAEEVGYPYVIRDAFSYLSKIYYEMGNYKQSEYFTLKQLALIDSTAITELMLVKRQLIPIYIQQSKKNEAISTLEKYNALMREVNKVEVQNTYLELQTKYETEKKELKIFALEDEKRFMMWLGISGGIVLLLALITFFLLWRWTVQRKQLAETQIKQFEQEKQLVATQSVLDGETRERARLARDLHDGLGSMLTGVRLNLQEIKNGVKLEYADVEHFDKALGLLDESVREMRRVSHHLMPDSLSRFGLKPAVNDFCRKFSANITFDYFGDESRLDPNLEVMIYRTIHELVNNALKHSGADSIMVQIMQEPNRISFTVEDNGCGFDLTAETKGIGLQNIRTRITAYNGNLLVDSRAGEGTEINVELKIEN